MWAKKRNALGGVTVFCDMCKKPTQGSFIVRIGITVVAELCGKHAEAMKTKIEKLLKTKPGPLKGETLN